MSVLVNASQNATGALQATQAGNQLVALAAQQIADLTAVSPQMAAPSAARRRTLGRRCARGAPAPDLPDAGRRLSAGQRPDVPFRQLRRRPVDSKTLARIGAVIFVAFAITAAAIDAERRSAEARPRAPGARRDDCGRAAPLPCARRSRRDPLAGIAPGALRRLGQAGRREPAAPTALAPGARRRFPGRRGAS